MCLADASTNPRPRRMIELLSGLGFQIDVACFPLKTELPIERHIIIGAFANNKILRRAARWLRRRCSEVVGRAAQMSGALSVDCAFAFEFTEKKLNINFGKYELISVHDLELLPLVCRSVRWGKIIFDAREFYPEEIGNSWWFRNFIGPIRHQMCADFLPQCDACMTVSEGLAKEYKSRFGVDIFVSYSAPHFRDLAPRPTSSTQVRMVHMGCANRDRKLENLIKVMRLLDKRFSLDLYLVGSKSYQKYLRRIAGKDKRIRFCEAVGYTDLVDTMHRYDIGFYYLEPTGFNVTYNLPNKFFEFIQARLAVAIGPSPEMGKLGRRYNCALVASEFSATSMASSLNRATASEIDELKAASHIAASDLCFEKERLKVIKIIDELL